MPAVSVSVEIEGLEALLLGLETGPEQIRMAMEDATQDSIYLVDFDAHSRVPWRTGRLYRSIDRSPVRDLGAEWMASVGTPLDYAPFVEFGTNPHEITPRMKQALWWPGARHPVRRVRHPGTRAQPFLRPALLDNAGRIVGIFHDAVATALRRVRG